MTPSRPAVGTEPQEPQGAHRFLRDYDVPRERSVGWQIGDWHCACGWWGSHEWMGYAEHLERELEARAAERDSTPGDRKMFDKCPVCGNEDRVDFLPNWQARVDAGAAIPIIACGNPWHYVGAEPARAAERRTLDAETIYAEIARHSVEPDPDAEGPMPRRCVCGGFRERAPHGAPWMRHLAESVAALPAARDSGREAREAAWTEAQLRAIRERVCRRLVDEPCFYPSEVMAQFFAALRALADPRPAAEEKS